MAGFNRFRIFTLVVLPLFLLASPLQAGQRKTARKAPVKQAVPAPAQQVTPAAAPPAELTLEQQPAVAPEVTYEGGNLTIVARNSTLGDIMRAIRTKTGAYIEFPGSGNERVVSSVGPGPARDVLASLLNGSSFNYVILGGATDPQALSRVILSPRPAGGVTSPVAIYQPGQMVQGQENQAQEQVEESEGTDAESEEQQEEPNLEQQQRPGPEGPPAGIKTPEQLLQELQRQQQLLQQQQQEQQQGMPAGDLPPQDPNRRDE